MKAQLLTKNVMIDGKRTTIRLETAVWEALDDICNLEALSRHDLCTQIEARRDGLNRAQAVRATVVNYYRFTPKVVNGNDGILDRALGGDVVLGGAAGDD